MLIVPSLSIYLLLIRPKSLPKLLIYLSFILSLGAAYFIIPPPQKGFFNQLLIWLLPIVEISVIIIVLYRIIKSIIRNRSHSKHREKDFLEITRMALEPKFGNGFVLHAAMTELSMFYYSLFVWFGKMKVTENKEVYSYYKTSQIKQIVIVFSILIILEGAFFHFLLQLWSDIAAWIFTVINIYGLLYMIGLYNSAKYLPHMVSSEQLIIRLGYQSSIKLDIRNIDSIKIRKDNSGIGEKKAKQTYYAMLDLDSAQYEIFLKEPALMESAYGRKKYVKTVVFRADNPLKMVEEIKSNMKALSCE
jgi:hypothetical protein